MKGYLENAVEGYFAVGFKQAQVDRAGKADCPRNVLVAFGPTDDLVAARSWDCAGYVSKTVGTDGGGLNRSLATGDQGAALREVEGSGSDN